MITEDRRVTMGNLMADSLRLSNDLTPLLMAHDLLLDEFDSHPEKEAYAKILKNCIQIKFIAPLKALDIVKKFGSKEERAYASRLVRRHHKMTKKGAAPMLVWIQTIGEWMQRTNVS